jgi:hypothetical protein
MYKSLMTYSTDEPRWVALKLKLGFVLLMKDLFVKPKLLEAAVSRRLSI